MLACNLKPPPVCYQSAQIGHALRHRHGLPSAVNKEALLGAQLLGGFQRRIGNGKHAYSKHNEDNEEHKGKLAHHMHMTNMTPQLLQRDVAVEIDIQDGEGVANFRRYYCQTARLCWLCARGPWLC
eukprot:CAMPEP_0170572086 /NCGR_PEP_ID=MMETSP0224-20130122/2024_1 /TAXON_ID=285029 /ORGANISM="Togula jolla, Strain CCCM 725" /LENGTH=125 /DNA_ID=CAMNT_0010894543 /DNA_START=647 /DNA_END=1024 /DNA_ORIENTATION=+